MRKKRIILATHEKCSCLFTDSTNTHGLTHHIFFKDILSLGNTSGESVVMVTIFLFIFLTNIWQPVCHLMLFLNSVTHSLLSNSLKKGSLDEEIVGRKQGIFSPCTWFQPMKPLIMSLNLCTQSTFSSSELWHDDVKSSSHLPPFFVKQAADNSTTPLLQIQSCLPCLLMSHSFEHGPIWVMICSIDQLKLSVVTSAEWVWFPTQVWCYQLHALILQNIIGTGIVTKERRICSVIMNLQKRLWTR